MRKNYDDLIFRGLAMMTLTIVAVAFLFLPGQEVASSELPQHESFWTKAVTDPVALFTLVLAISTVGYGS